MKIFVLFLLFTSKFFPFELPEFKEVKLNHKKSDVQILDRNERLLNETRINKNFRTTDWKELEEISPALVKALLIAEDKNFYEHKGVDWFAMFNGFFRYISFRSKRGASTISMQLVSFLNEDLKSKKGGRGFSQKWDQIQFALEIEKKWSKQEILEAYFNLAPFKGELIGVDSASRAIFKKQPHGITNLEASILVSFFKSPSGNEERIYKRACYIYLQIEKEENCDSIKNKVQKIYIESNFILSKNSLAFHLTQYAKKNGSTKIITTLDKNIQLFAEENIAMQILHLKNKNVKDASLILLENKTGNILAYVGSSEKTSDSKEIDGVISERQAGSTLKPFIYAMAIENKLISEYSIINDNPLDIQVGTGIYSPSNYQDKFHGDVTARVALASSLNVPAVKVLNMLNKDEFISKLSDLGFTDLREAEFYGPSIALGSIDVRLVELTNAYRTLANNGFFSEIQFIEQEKKESKSIFKKETAQIISEILSDKEARSITFGFENPLVTKFPTSVKTGTSKDMRDNWCIGYDENYTLGVWVGNFSGEPMWNVSGVTGAAPIWKKMMNHLSKNEFKIVEFKKTEMDKTETLKPINNIKIISPVKNAIYAIDPDMPEDVSAIFFETNIKNPDFYFQMKELRIGDTSKIRFWKPKIGRHRLKLFDKKNSEIESIDFEIR